MTLNDWLREQDGRCPRCLMHETAQGHRSIDSAGVRTGCRDEGPASAAVVALREAEARRDAGMARTVAAHPDDAARVDAVLARFISSGRPFSANDTRRHLSGVKGSVIGSRFLAASKAKRMKRTGNRFPSTDPGTHSHHIDEWIGVAA